MAIKQRRCGRQSQHSGCQQAKMMNTDCWWRRNTSFDSRIWSELPQELLLLILARLPIKSLLRLRCVSRGWNQSLTSAEFAALQARVAPSSSSPARLPWILMFQCHNYKDPGRVVRAFDRSSNKWFTISLAFLPPYVTDMAAASGGLVIFKTIHPGLLLVSNPLRSSWRDLPRLRSASMARAAVVALVTSSSGFKVIVAGLQSSDEHFCERVTEVFDSTTNSWSTIRAPGIGFNFRSETCSSGQTIHFATSSDPPVLFSLDLEQRKWSRSTVPLPERMIYCIPVASESGALHLVGGRGQHGIAKTVSIWKMGGDREQRWTEIDSMPEDICSKFAATCFHNYEHISGTAQQNLICLSCFTWPQAFLYCFPRSSWMWLPRCNQVPLRSNAGFKWFSLEPSLKQI